MSDASSGNSERYELEELFPDDSPETLNLLKVVGGFIVVVLVLAALIYPLLHLK